MTHSQTQIQNKHRVEHALFNGATFVLPVGTIRYDQSPVLAGLSDDGNGFYAMQGGIYTGHGENERPVTLGTSDIDACIRQLDEQEVR